jgi:mannose-6-phosphate isomerase-like protein (cupin superfamily)
MTQNFAEVQARRLITGEDENGKSYFVEDANTPVRHTSHANTKCDIWRASGVPVSVHDMDGMEDRLVHTSPDKGGFVYRLVTFRPDSEWDASEGFGDANGPLRGMVPAEEADGIVGLHYTETVDILTVLSGELTSRMQHGEKVLRAGDTIVQRGTKHMWYNRTNELSTAVVLMVSATR